MAQATKKCQSAILTSPITYFRRKPILGSIDFRMEAFDIFKAMVPSNHMSYRPKFYCTDS